MAKTIGNIPTEGYTFGQTVSDKIAFYGISPTVQLAVSSGVATTSATTITQLNTLISQLGLVGVIKAT